MEQNGAQWVQIHQLDQKIITSIYSLYKDPFFIEVRSFLSLWLEDKFRGCNLDAENSTHHPYICQLIGELNAEIKSRARQLGAQDQFAYISVRLTQSSESIEGIEKSSKKLGTDKPRHINRGYPMAPIPLYHHIQYCLGRESELVRQAHLASTDIKPRIVDGITEMWSGCNELNVKISAMARVLKQVETCQANCNIQASTLQNLDRILTEHRTRSKGVPCPDALADFDFEQSITCQKDQQEREILQQVSRIDEKRKCLQEKLDEILANIKEFQAKVLKLLATWKIEQQTTLHHTVSIDEIEKWCEVLADVNLNVSNQIQDIAALQKSFVVPPFASKYTSELFSKDNSENINKIAELLKDLIHHAYIVESQPQQVIKKNTKFMSTIRFLIGNKLSLAMGATVNVDASILNEAGVREVIRKNGSGKTKTSGELLNNKQKFQLDGGTTRYCAEFRNIHVKKVTHNAKKESGHSVLDEPFWLLFQTQFVYNNVVYKVFTISVPIKVISHVSQESQAWETLVWGDSERESGKQEYKPWSELSQLLNNKFTMMTRKSLTPEHMRAIEEKAFSVPDGIAPTNSSNVRCLSWTQFCKNKLPGRKFTFWNWFYEIAKLTAEHLCGNKFCKSGPWQDDLILGFIGREDAEQLLLRNGKCGAFLLRFSDGTLGGISISWLHINKTVMSVTPFTAKDLIALSLAERILGIAYLLYLHPDTSKHQAFQSYVPTQQKESTTANGTVRLTKSKYVRALLTTQLLLGDMSLSMPSPSPSECPESPDVAMWNPMLSMPTPEMSDPIPDDTMEMELGETWIKDLADYVLELCEVAENSPEPEDGYTNNGEDGYHSGDGSPLSAVHSPNDLQYIHL